MNVVKLSHPLLPDFRVKYSQTFITFSSSHHARKFLASPHSLCGNDVLHVYMKKTLRSHEKALSEFNINIPAVFFKCCIKPPASREFAAPAASAYRTAGDARAIPLAARDASIGKQRWGFE